MGFFDTLGKMINGEPLNGVQPPQSSRPSGDAPQAAASSGAADPTRDSAGQKVVPDVRPSRLKTSRSGNRMMSHVWFQNQSPYEVELTKMTIMGQGLSMNYRLAAGQGREVKLYDGPVAQHDKQHQAHLDFKIVQNGDYFQQEFFVEFDPQADGMYLIEELHPEHHVRDT